MQSRILIASKSYMHIPSHISGSNPQPVGITYKVSTIFLGQRSKSNGSSLVPVIPGEVWNIVVIIKKLSKSDKYELPSTWVY